jgi:hypothetical protein
MTKKDLFKLVAKAYPCEFPASRAQALRHEVGDTLGDFVYIELDDTQHNVVDFDEAERVIQTAIDDLQAVLNAITAAHSKEAK